MRRYLNLLPALVVLVALAAFLLSGCGPTPHERKVAEQRARLPFTVRVKSSESMHGFKPGDMLRITAEPYSELKIGDPVFFWSPDKPIPTFHYIVDAGMPAAGFPPHRRWVTKGDANKNSDYQLLSESTYIGKWTPIKN